MTRAPGEAAPGALALVGCHDPLVPAEVADQLVRDPSHPAVAAAVEGGGGGLAAAYLAPWTLTVLLGPRIHEVADLPLQARAILFPYK